MTTRLLSPPGTTAGRPGYGQCPGGCRSRGTPVRSSGEYAVIDSDARRRVAQTTQAPYRYICNLEYDGWAFGTGTLIGERTVLTAGHCVHDEHGRPLVARRMRVVPGRNGALEPLPATQAVGFHVFPGYRAASPTDLALVRLANPVGRRVGFWRADRLPSARDPLGTSMSATLPQPAGTVRVNVSGYPGDLPRDPRLRCRVPGRGACEASSVSQGRDRTRCGTEQWRSFDRTSNLSVPGMLLYLDDTCPGHSGSPVWVTRAPDRGGRVLVGVHVQASPDRRTNRAVRLTPRNLEWIARHTT